MTPWTQALTISVKWHINQYVYKTSLMVILEKLCLHEGLIIILLKRLFEDSYSIYWLAVQGQLQIWSYPQHKLFTAFLLYTPYNLYTHWFMCGCWSAANDFFFSSHLKFIKRERCRLKLDGKDPSTQNKETQKLSVRASITSKWPKWHISSSFLTMKLHNHVT